MQSIIFSSEAIIKVSVRTKKSRKLCVLNSSIKKCMHLKRVRQVRWFAKLVLHTICERMEKQTFVNTTLSERKIKCEFKKKGTVACLPHPWQVPGNFCFIFAHAPLIAVLHFPGGRYYSESGFCWYPSFPHKHTKCILTGWISRCPKPVLLTKQKSQVEPLFVLVVVEGGLF